MDAARATAATVLGALRARVVADRLARWSAVALVPAVWLSIALANAWLLLLAPLAAALLAALFRFGPYERFEQPDELY